MAVIDPTDYEDLEMLRSMLVDVFEQRLDEVERPVWAKNDQKFHFTRSQIVVFDTEKKINEPSELTDAVANMSVGSIFYHYIDARRRFPRGIDDFRAWLDGFGDKYHELCVDLAAVDPYFSTLTELRQSLIPFFTIISGGIINGLA